MISKLYLLNRCETIVKVGEGLEVLEGSRWMGRLERLPKGKI
jgi:hypothetical protein